MLSTNGQEQKLTLQPNYWKRRYFRWIDKRTPVAKNITLTRNNLFIFPSFTGLGYLGLSALLWLLGTTYQNNLVLALSYLLFSLIVVAIFYTYANLSGLTINALGAKPAFVGENAVFILQVSSKHHKEHNNIQMRWWKGESKYFDFEKNQQETINLTAYADQRGLLNPGKLLIETCFPLGLLRCWTWLNVETSALVYPKPLAIARPQQSTGEFDDGLGEEVAGGDEFSGLKVYREGDSLKHIAWKHYAREQGLYVKEYISTQYSEAWLNWDDFAHLNSEDRLSALCYWCLQFEKEHIAYGLQLSNTQLAPDVGSMHQAAVLSRLARFDTGLGG